MQPECISQRASSGRLNCSCSRSRDLTAINPVVPEMMKIAALAVSTAPGGNMSFAFSKSVPIAPAKGRGKRTPAWTNRRAKALVPCGFADAKTAKGILQYQNSRKRLSNCPRIPREEVRKYGSFQSGAKYGIYRYEQPPLAKQGIVLKGKGLVVANAFAARRLGLSPLLLRLQSVCLYRSYRPAARQAAAARWISPHCCSGRKIDLPKYDTGLQGHRIPVNSAVVPCSRYSQGSAGKYITRRLPFCGSRRIHFSRLL